MGKYKKFLLYICKEWLINLQKAPVKREILINLNTSTVITVLRWTPHEENEKVRYHCNPYNQWWLPLRIHKECN